MKKSNLILQAAIASALLAMTVGAQAGNLATTTRTFAAENFGATQAATVALTPAAISYAVSSPGGVTVAVGQTTTIYFRLSGTHTFTVAPAAIAFTGAIPTALGIPVVTWAAGATAGTVAVTFTNTTLAAVNLPVNFTLIYTPAVNAITATTATLAAVGGVVSVTGSMSGLVANNAAVTLPADQDAVSLPANIAVSAAAVTGAVRSSAAFALPGEVAESKKIDLGAVNGVSTAFAGAPSNTVPTSVVNLGSYAFTNNATVIPTTLAGVNYALGVANAGAGAIFAGTTATIAPGAAQSFPIGAQFAIYTNPACTTLASALSAAITTTTAATAVAIPATGANAVPGTDVQQYVCMTVPVVAPFATIAPVAPTLAVALKKTVATDAANNIVATAVYPLVYNGSQVDVRNYVPAAAVGYATTVRVINTGAVSAPISVALIDDATGVVSVAGVVGMTIKGVAVTTLPAGAQVNLTQAQIEAVTGPIAVTSRPRIRITAPTTGLQVQSFLSQPTNTIVDMTGAQ